MTQIETEPPIPDPMPASMVTKAYAKGCVRMHLETIYQLTICMALFHGFRIFLKGMTLSGTGSSMQFTHNEYAYIDLFTTHRLLV